MSDRFHFGTYNSNISTTSDTGFSRREFLKAGVGVGGLAIAGASMASPAIAADATIKIGFISPITGPLASFGESDGFILKQVREALKGGVAIGGKTYGVEIIDKDTQSDPARAGQLAKELINSDKVDLMLSDLDAGSRQSGRRRLRGRGRALAVDGHALGRLSILVVAQSRARRRRSNGASCSASASPTSSTAMSRSGTAR